MGEAERFPNGYICRELGQSPAVEPFSAALPGHWRGAGLEVEKWTASLMSPRGGGTAQPAEPQYRPAESILPVFTWEVVQWGLTCANTVPGL